MMSVRGAGIAVLAWSILGCGSVSPGGGGKDAAAGGGGSSGTAGASGAAGGEAGANAAGAGGAAGSAGADGTAGAGGDSALGGAGGAGGATSPAPPGDFALKTPLNGDPTISANPTLTWAASSGASSYVVEIATAPTFGASDVEQKSDLTTTSYMVANALMPGVIYYWRVSAVGGSAQTYSSSSPFTMSVPVDAGPSPHGVAVTPDGKQAIITNDKPAGSVTWLDLTAFTTKTLALTGQPGQVAVTPDGTRALVAEGSPNDVAVIDLAMHTVASKITPPCIATTLYGIAVSPDGSTAVLPDVNSACTKDVLDVIPLPSAKINSTWDLASSAGAFGVAVGVNSSSALVTRGILGTSITLVDLLTGTLTSIPIGSASFGAVILKSGVEALVTSGEGDTIKRVLFGTKTVYGTIAFETNQDVGNIALSPSGTVAVAVGDFKIGIIKLPDATVTRTFSLAGRSVAITPDGRRALVTGAGATGKVYVVPLP
jgi:DNA-binding beta-propeller fold protein YncE